MADEPTRRQRNHGEPNVADLLKDPTVSRETPEEEAAGGEETSAGFAAAASPASFREDLRGDMRVPEGARGESSRERAERRAHEIMGHLEGALDESDERFFIDPSIVPEGWSYEWKKKTVYGQGDPAYDTRLARTGWEPVQAERHPAMMPKGYRGEIVRDGLVLMERPAAITAKVKAIELRRARGAVQLKEQQLSDAPDGTFQRVDGSGRSAVKIGHSYSPVTIPVPET